MSFLRRNYFLQVLFFSLVFLLFSKVNVFAATITLNSAKTQISASEEFPVDINLTISVSDGTAYYLRGVFYKPGTNQYCGFTWNGNSWFSGPYSSNEGWKNFQQVTVSNNSWQGQLKAKIDSGNSGCKDSGSYNFKVERFTQGGNGTFDSQEVKTVEIVIPTPSPTLTPIPTPTRIPTPTKTPTSAPTAKSIAALTTKPTPTIKKQAVLLTSVSLVSPVKINLAKTGDSGSLNQSNGSSIEAVLAENIVNTTITPSLTVTPETEKSAKSDGNNKNYIPIILISIGVIFIVACGIIVLWSYKKNKNTTNNDF